MLDWLIIGGGVHGTHLSLSLMRRNRISPDRLRVLDPHQEPLHAWRQRCAVTGMTHLRSPVAHHIGLGTKSLRRFAGRRKLSRGTLQSPFDRPSLELFERHCQHLVHEHQLQELRIQGSAKALELGQNHVRVETENGSLETRRAVLALGPAKLDWPDWASEAKRAGAPVNHCFSPEFCHSSISSEGELLVIGGGQSAVQLALDLAARRPGSVTLLSRHPWRVAHFDAEPTWINSGLRRFQTQRCMRTRRKLLNRARLSGSVTSRELRRFRCAEKRGHVRHHVGEVEVWNKSSTGIQLTLAHSGKELNCTQVLLATGFCATLPGGTWLSEAADAVDLPRAPCGHPIVDQVLRWHPRLHLAGSMAELELGPSAHNIIGARMAAERLARLG